MFRISLASTRFRSLRSCWLQRLRTDLRISPLFRPAFSSRPFGFQVFVVCFRPMLCCASCSNSRPTREAFLVVPLSWLLLAVAENSRSFWARVERKINALSTWRPTPSHTSPSQTAKSGREISLPAQFRRSSVLGLNAAGFSPPLSKPRAPPLVFRCVPTTPTR